MNEPDLDGKLARLGARTAELRPGPGFEDRVLAAIGTGRPQGWDASVLRFGRVMLAVAALSAVTGAMAGFQSLSSETEASATLYGMEDLEW